MEHKHTAEEEWRIRDAALDETIEASFPASDPPSTLPNPDDHTVLEEQPQPHGVIADQSRTKRKKARS